MRLCRLGSCLCAIAISSGNFTCFLRNKTQGVEMYRKGRSAPTKGGMFLSMDATLLGGMRRIANPTFDPTLIIRSQNRNIGTGKHRGGTLQ